MSLPTEGDLWMIGPLGPSASPIASVLYRALGVRKLSKGGVTFTTGTGVAVSPLSRAPLAEYAATASDNRSRSGEVS